MDGGEHTGRYAEQWEPQNSLVETKHIALL